MDEQSTKDWYEEGISELYRALKGTYVQRQFSSTVRKFTPDAVVTKHEFVPDPDFPQYKK
jgi:hypothetical protein